MKKKFIFLSVFMIAVVFITSCQSKPKEVNYKPITLNFELEEGQSETGCFYGSESIIFSIGERNGRPEGPLVNTVSLVLYDYIKEKVLKEFPVNSDAYICSAIPYKEGILYLDYEGVFEDVTWKLTFINDEGATIVKDGICSSYEHTPVLRFIDETPCFFWEDGNFCGLSKIVDDEIIQVFEREKQSPGPSYFTTNGHEFFFLEGNDYGNFVIGDMSGIKYEYPSDKKIISFAITQDYIACSLAKDENYSLLKIDLKKGIGEEVNMDEPLYRLEGIGKNTCFGVYNNFESFQLNLKDNKLSETPYPKDLQGTSSPRIYYRVSEDIGIAVFSPIASFSTNGGMTDSYYLMSVS